LLYKNGLPIPIDRELLDLSARKKEKIKKWSQYSIEKGKLNDLGT
jgi:hypothetical protein